MSGEGFLGYFVSKNCIGFGWFLLPKRHDTVRLASLDDFCACVHFHSHNLLNENNSLLRSGFMSQRQACFSELQVNK